MLARDKIVDDIEQSTTSLVEAVAAFPPAQLHKRPDADRWSAAEIVEHVVIMEELVNQLLLGKTEKTLSRDPEEKIKYIRDTFLDIGRPLSAAQRIYPIGQGLDFQIVLYRFKHTRQYLKDIVLVRNLSARCLGFEHQIFGYLTRVEWVYFNLYHSARHLNQLMTLQAV